jgi:hypothetical protein
MLWGNIGFVFGNRILSALTPRINVKCSFLSDSYKYYSEEHGFRVTIYVQFSNDDIEHWKNSHPLDDYKTIFSGSTEVGWYCFEPYQDKINLYKLNNGICHGQLRIFQFRRLKNCQFSILEKSSRIVDNAECGGMAIDSRFVFTRF